MKQWLIKRIKKLFENIESTITTVIVLAILGGSIGILASSKKALNIFLQIVNIPTPLWATIVLVFLVITYIKMKKSSPSSNLNYKIKYFTIDNLKWKTKIFHENYFEVDKISICREHDLPLIHENIYYYCPEFRKKNCKIMIDHNDYSFIYETAKSYIDKEIRNNKIKC